MESQSMVWLCYDIYTAEDKLQNFIKLFFILNKFYMFMQRFILLFHGCNCEVICRCIHDCRRQGSTLWWRQKNFVTDNHRAALRFCVAEWLFSNESTKSLREAKLSLKTLKNVMFHCLRFPCIWILILNWDLSDDKNGTSMTLCFWRWGAPWQKNMLFLKSNIMRTTQLN